MPFSLLGHICLPLYPDWSPGVRFGLTCYRNLKKVEILVFFWGKPFWPGLFFNFLSHLSFWAARQGGQIDTTRWRWGINFWEDLASKGLQEDQSMWGAQEDRKGTQEDPRRDRHALQAYTSNRELLKKWKWSSALTIGVLENNVHTHSGWWEIDRTPATKFEMRGS